MIAENIVTLLASSGGFGALGLLLCLLAARQSKRHPAFRWWFWRLGFVPAIAAAYAIYIRLTPRTQIDGSDVNYGRLDFFAVISWGVIVPILYLAFASIVLFCLSFVRGDKE